MGDPRTKFLLTLVVTGDTQHIGPKVQELSEQYYILNILHKTKLQMWGEFFSGQDTIVTLLTQFEYSNDTICWWDCCIITKLCSVSV